MTISINWQTPIHSGTTSYPELSDKIVPDLLEQNKGADWVILSTGNGKDQTALLLSEAVLQNPTLFNVQFFGNMLVQEDVTKWGFDTVNLEFGYDDSLYFYNVDAIESETPNLKGYRGLVLLKDERDNFLISELPSYQMLITEQTLQDADNPAIFDEPQSDTDSLDEFLEMTKPTKKRSTKQTESVEKSVTGETPEIKDFF